MSTIFITGANRGLGLELTRQYAEAGNHVLACCRSPETADELQALSNEFDVDVRKLDVVDADSVSRLGAALDGVCIDTLINNAGTMGPAREQQTTYVMDFDGWSEAFAVNTMAPVRMMQTLLPNLRKSENPKVVTITSQLGALSLDMPVAFAYSASRAAVNKFMRLAAIDLRRERISVGLIHPGWVRTDMGGPTADLSPAESARGVIAVIAGIGLENSGKFWKWNGEPHRW